MDIDVIMSWPLKKLYGYMAFYITETEEFKKKQKLTSGPQMTFDEICAMMDADGALVKDD